MALQIWNIKCNGNPWSWLRGSLLKKIGLNQYPKTAIELIQWRVDHCKLWLELLVKRAHINALKVLSSFFCITLWLINAICDLLFAHILYPDIQPAKILRQNLARAQFVERLWDFPLSQFVTYEATWDVDVFCRGIIQIRTHFSSPTKAAKVPGGSENTKQKQNLLFISTSQEASSSCWFISSFKHRLGISARRSSFVLFLQLRGFSLKYFWSHYEKVNNQELLW